MNYNRARLDGVGRRRGEVLAALGGGALCHACEHDNGRAALLDDHVPEVVHRVLQRPLCGDVAPLCGVARLRLQAGVGYFVSDKVGDVCCEATEH